MQKFVKIYGMITGRFGVEIELNSLDSRDFVKNPLIRGESPSGLLELSSLLSSAGFSCEVQEWQYNHDPVAWSCKPDSSCGIELCSPVMDLDGIAQLSYVMDILKASSFMVDERCSFHVHLEFPSTHCDNCLGSILAWWIKCEHVFFDAFPPQRKNNGYCKPIGLTGLFDSDDVVCGEVIFKKLSSKHFSVNTFHIFNRRRATIEFRLAEGTKDSFFATMWVRTLLRFAERASDAGLPNDYRWISPKDALDFIDLEGDVRDWFLDRLRLNSHQGASEFFSEERRAHACVWYEELSGKK